MTGDPRPPLPHRVLSTPAAFRLFRLIGKPTITVRYGNTVTVMQRGDGDMVHVKTQRRLGK